MGPKNDCHINSLASSLTLKQSLGETRRWPIVKTCLITLGCELRHPLP